MNDRERIEFVETLQVPSSTRGGPEVRGLERADDVPEVGDGAVVAGGSVLAFTAELKGQARHDVLDSTLLAQLAANVAHSRDTEVIEWARHYTNTLETIGWNLQGFAFSDHSRQSGTLTLDAAALGVLQALLEPTGLTVLKSTVDALRELADDAKAIELLSGAATSGRTGLFQLGAASHDADGNTTMALGTFHFVTTAQNARFLFVSWRDDQVRLQYATARAVLNDRVYGVVRETVASKLAASRIDAVASIRIE